MAFADLSRVFQKQAKGSPGWAEKLFAVVLLGTMIAALGIRNILPADALTPVITTLLFTLAAAAAGFALLWRRKQRRTMWLDLAGVLTFVGVAISILIEPDQLVRLFTHSDQPD